MTRKRIAVFLSAILLGQSCALNSFSQLCVPKKSPGISPLSQEEMNFLTQQPADNALLNQRAGGCFTDCFLSPFGSEECDACRSSASQPMPEWSPTEKILWSLGGILLAAGMIWISNALNKGNNCNSSSACANPYGYGGNSYGYYTDPYGNYSGGYYGSSLRSAGINVIRKK